MARIHLLLHRFTLYEPITLSVRRLTETLHSVVHHQLTTSCKLPFLVCLMASVAAKRTLLSTKAKAFSIASLVEEGKDSECGQPDDKETTEEGVPSTSKKRKMMDYVADSEEKVAKSQAILEGRELWDCFYRLGTEMIITKSGRRMFPPLRVSFTGLDTSQSYAVVLDIVPLDNKRHRYSYTDSAWFVAGEADPTPPRRIYTHPESPFTGEELSRQVLSFERVKLTNNPKDSNGNIILNSMHKYQPRVHLIQNTTDSTVSEQDLEKADTFVFHETAFMAVTAYQNHLITRLKIYSNPFAKGFRDTTRLLPNFEEEGYVVRSDDYSRCCDSIDGMCCHLSGQLSCYHDARDVIDPRLLTSHTARWACSDDCCSGSDFPWRSPHDSTLVYPRSLDFYSSDGTPYTLLSCSTTLTDERLRDY